MAGLGCLKVLYLPTSQAGVLLLVVVLCTIASTTIALRSRYRYRLTELSQYSAFQGETSQFFKDQASRYIELDDKPSSNFQNEPPVKNNARLGTKLTVTMLLATLCGLLLLGHRQFSWAMSNGLQAIQRSSEQPSSSAGLLEVFQVYQPISPVPAGLGGCDLDLLLMDNVFGYSYGHPFVGSYEPPNCMFDTVTINLTVTSRGRQFDRLAFMYLGDMEVFRTSTAEPTSAGITWTYIKDLSGYNALWQKPQKLIFDLGNLINDVYTGSYNVTLTAHFSYEQNARTADYILPISAKRSASNSSSVFTVPNDNTTVVYTIPSAASRAVVSISACGQSTEEFWWSNVFSQDTEDFDSTVGELYGYSPFREIQLYIDGGLAGVVWPFPIIFTGGVAPGFWRPIVGIDAFDLRQPEIDISPFLPMLQDGQEHSFEIRVTGLEVLADGSATLANTVGSYWNVAGNILLYTDGSNATSNAITTGSAPQVEAPPPTLTVTRHLVQNKTGTNESLSYSVVGERTFSATSPYYSWSQKLSFSNYGVINQQGYSQVNKQLTSGHSTTTKLQDNPSSNVTTFKYPLVVNATYGITSDSLTVDAWMSRGLQIESSGGPGISTYTLVSGPSQLNTHQYGQASYQAISGQNSTSSGATTDDFHSTSNGQSYSRSVKAVNGSVVYDTNPMGSGSTSSSHDMVGLGRDSVRSMLGRGPGNNA